MKQFNRYIVYSFGSTRVFFGVTGFQVASLPVILYLCKIKCRNSKISCCFTFIKYCIFAILLSSFNNQKKTVTTVTELKFFKSKITNSTKKIYKNLGHLYFLFKQ